MKHISEVEVGDKVMYMYRGELRQTPVVTRLTKTQIICGNSKYQRATGYSVGRDQWSDAGIYLYDEKVVLAAKEKRLSYKLTKQLVDKLGSKYQPSEILQQMLDLID